MKEIYSFDLEIEKEVEKTVEKKRKNKETGEQETVSTTKTVKEPVVHRIILKEPNRRQLEDADMEYSIEMSKCIKNGILTKAMLAKKYSDTGGLLSEEDARFLTRKYSELGDLQNKFGRLSAKPKKEKKDEDNLSSILGQIGEKRKEIVDMETSYSSLFNHTADSKAQNKVLLWYLVNLSYYRISEDEECIPFFNAEETEEKIDQYYEVDEEGHEIFDMIKDKITTILSFWYFSQGANLEDFDQLNKDIDSGDV